MTKSDNRGGGAPTLEEIKTRLAALRQKEEEHEKEMARLMADHEKHLARGRVIGAITVIFTLIVGFFVMPERLRLGYVACLVAGVVLGLVLGKALIWYSER